MATFERSKATSVSAAPAMLALVPRATAEPMQRAIDAWYREQPEAFARTAEPRRRVDEGGGVDRAIALNHLLAYGRLAAEQDLANLHERATKDGSPVLAPLLRQVEARNAELLGRVPAELHPALSAGLAASAERLAGKAATIEAATAGRRQAEALEQSVALGAALLRRDPGQYETLVADAGAMVEGLGLEDGPRQVLGRGIRRQLAEAALLAQADPAAGDPDAAAADLARGRFRDAFDVDGIKAWRELVAFQQKRRAAQAALAMRDAGIVEELKMLNRLAAAGRGEAPMPAPVEVEAVFPGEGEQRLAAVEHERTRRLYADEIALQPFDQDRNWIAAGESDDDIQLRRAAAWEKHKQFAKSGGGDLLKQSPELAAAIEAGVEDPSKLNLAIDLYQRQLRKLGVPPKYVRLLPDEALARLSAQFGALGSDDERADWILRLVAEVGDDRAVSILQSLKDVPGGARFEFESQDYALDRTEGPRPIAPGHPEDEGVYERLLDLHRRGDLTAFGDLAESVGFTRSLADLFFDVLAVTPKTPDPVANQLLDRINRSIPDEQGRARAELTILLSELRRGHFNQNAHELRKTYDRFYETAAPENPDTGDPISEELQQNPLNLLFGLAAGARRPRKPAITEYNREQFLRSLNLREIESFTHPEVRALKLQFDEAVRERSEAAALAKRFGEPFNQIRYNNKVGLRFEELVRAILRAEGHPVEVSGYEFTHDHIKYRSDGTIEEISGKITRIEAKSSMDSRHTTNQKAAYGEHDAWVIRLDNHGRLRIMKFSEEMGTRPSP